jgi:NADPH-dependent curcumin reductase CurA
LVYLYTQRVKFQGFISSDYSDQLPQFYEGMRTWIEEGRVKWKETILEGIENAA